MTRRIWEALSAVSCGSSRMPRRSSVRVLRAPLHFGGHLPHALQRFGEALRGLREHLVRLAACWP
jgi:hypothetical protein